MDAQAPSRSVATIARPYRGTDSYGVEHADLFFGREREAEELVRKILCSRFTLLYAPSGAGKTSLLNARIIPGLERRDCLPVVVRVEDHPINATKNAILRTVIPDPGAEALAVQRAINALELEEDTSVSDVAAAYRSLDVADERRIILISPVRIPALATDVEDVKQVSPFFSRFLRGCMTIERLEQFYGPLLPGRTVKGSGPGGAWLTRDRAVGDVKRLMQEESVVNAYLNVVSAVGVPGMTLCEFAENLFSVWGTEVGHLSLVLILDQFEEIFTRFVDEGHHEGDRWLRSHWGKRWKFFRQLEDLYEQVESSIDSDDDDEAFDDVRLPIRFVVSMREEYVARLQPIRAFVKDIDRSSFYLWYLSKDGARLAIEEPARACGHEYTADIPRNIISELAREDRFVHPAPLQIVCTLLWREHEEKQMHGHWAARERDSSALELLRQADGVNGILRSFFDEFLERPEGNDTTFANDNDRLEILEILQPLITSSRTRNIVEVSQLTDVPFRDVNRRRRMVRALEDGNIIRIEERLGSRFAEIKHEFLIDPILSTVREKLSANEVHTRFRVALRLLEGLERQERESGDRHVRPSETVLDDPSVVLRNHDYQALNASRGRVRWSSWSKELMLRSAVFRGSRADIAYWANEVSDDEELSAAMDVIDEFVTTSTKAVRARAGRALAALGTAESISRLIKLAVNDTSGSVRRSAEQELADLDGRPEEHLVDQLTAVLLPEQGVSVNVTNPWYIEEEPPAPERSGLTGLWAKLNYWWERRGPWQARRSPVGDAYMLLGRLRRYGSDLELAKPRTLRRLRLVWASRHSLSRRRKIEQAWRESLTPSLVGAAVGLLAFGAYLIFGPGSTQSSNAITLMIVTVPLFAPVLAFFATHRSAPLCDETYPMAALLMAAGGSVVPSLLIAVSSLVSDPQMNKGWLLVRALLAGAALTVFLTGIRAATVTAHGVRSSPKQNQWVQTLIGGGTGIVIATLFAYLPPKIAEWLRREEPFELEPFAIIAWFMLVPSAVGIAHAFASQDRIGLVEGGAARPPHDSMSADLEKHLARRGNSEVRRAASRPVQASYVIRANHARIGTVLLGTIGVVFLLLPFWGGIVRRPDDVPSFAELADNDTIWTIAMLPARTHIAVDRGTQSQLVVEAEKSADFQVVFELYFVKQEVERDLRFSEQIGGTGALVDTTRERFSRALEEPGTWELQVFRRDEGVSQRPPAWCDCAWAPEELFYYFVDMAPRIFGGERWGGRFEQEPLEQRVDVIVTGRREVR